MNKLTKLEKAKAMKCYGGVAEIAELDPDPVALMTYQENYNCINCSCYKYCLKLATTLKHFVSP